MPYQTESQPRLDAKQCLDNLSKAKKLVLVGNGFSCIYATIHAFDEPRDETFIIGCNVPPLEIFKPWFFDCVAFADFWPLTGSIRNHKNYLHHAYVFGPRTKKDGHKAKFFPAGTETMTEGCESRNLIVAETRPFPELLDQTNGRQNYMSSGHTAYKFLYDYAPKGLPLSIYGCDSIFTGELLGYSHSASYHEKPKSLRRRTLDDPAPSAVVWRDMWDILFERYNHFSRINLHTAEKNTQVEFPNVPNLEIIIHKDEK